MGQDNRIDIEYMDGTTESFFDVEISMAINYTALRIHLSNGGKTYFIPLTAIRKWRSWRDEE